MMKFPRAATVATILVVGVLTMGASGCDPQVQQTGSQAGQNAPVENNDPSVPAEHKSALAKATQYANTMHMSKQGVYDQLVSDYGEKFSAPAAQYAVDNVKADWNANALAKAKQYQSTMNMSPAAIRDQLTSSAGEKFTPAEADFAIQHLNG
jgi:host cell surface-exposed lipoprotein